MIKFQASLLLCLLLTSCATTVPPTSLYSDLGGEVGVANIVDAFLLRMAEDEVIVDQFADTDIDEFRQHLIDQICELAGGTCIYSGRTMLEAHRDLGVDSRQFNALVADLMQAMDDVSIAQGPQNRLLALLAPMHGDIVSPYKKAPIRSAR